MFFTGKSRLYHGMDVWLSSHSPIILRLIFTQFCPCDLLSGKSVPITAENKYSDENNREVSFKYVI